MGLGFSGAGADGCPANEIGDVLRRYGVKELGSGWEPEVHDLLEEFAGAVEAFLYICGSVEIGIHDETLPTERGARFFEIDPHDHEDALFHFLAETCQSAGVLETRFCVVDGTRSNNE